jgi:hypothetical protein
MMNPLFVYQLIGYMGSALVIVSHMMRSVRKLRLINLGGAICFVAYALLIRAYPVAVVNGLIILINLRHLYEMYSAREYFRRLEVLPHSIYMNYFLHFYEPDIQRFQPGFTYHPSEQQLTFFILRDMVPAGLFIAEPLGPDSLLVKLDYVIPGYRDFKTGKYLFFDQADFFKSKGIRHIYSEPGDKKHAAYLKRMGFIPASGKYERLYCLTIE